MIFTQEQIDEISRRLSSKGKKDTQFPRANTPIQKEDVIPIIQEDMNKVIPVAQFVRELQGEMDAQPIDIDIIDSITNNN